MTIYARLFIRFAVPLAALLAAGCGSSSGPGAGPAASEAQQAEGDPGDAQAAQADPGATNAPEPTTTTATTSTAFLNPPVPGGLLGTAGDFAVLAGSTVTNTGPTVIVGDLGVSPGLAVTGFPSGQVPLHTIHSGDAVALQAQSDLTAAYIVLESLPTDHDLTGQDLGNASPLKRGVYGFATSAQLTGTLVLDAEGDADAVFVFQIGSTLTTASGATVQVINGATVCNVFWQVGSSATLGVGTSFSGNILALTSITLNTSANIAGRALARNGAVTLDTNVVSTAACVSSPSSPAILTMTPTAGPVGTTVTILAQHVGSVLVDFNGTAAVASTTSGPLAGQTIISVTVPAGATSGQVHVDDAGSGTTLDAGVFTVTPPAPPAPPCPPPAILCVEPLAGCVGTTVKILVEGIGASVEIDFNGTPAPYAITHGPGAGQHELHVSVPFGATTGPLHVFDVESRTFLYGGVFVVESHPSHSH